MTGNQEDRPVEFPAEGEENYEQLLDDYSHLTPPAEGEVMMGHVLEVTAEGLIVDVGLKQEGFVPIGQVSNPDGTVSYGPGDSIEVMLDRRGEMEGYILLSHERASRIRACRHAAWRAMPRGSALQAASASPCSIAASMA